MKKHTLLSDLAVFLLIIFLFIVPPFFVISPTTEDALFSLWKFPWYQLLLALLSLVLLFFYYEKSSKRTLIVFPVLFTFGMLFAISLFCRFLSELFADKYSTVPFNAASVVRPDGFLQWLFCLINFFCAAFYEEVLYRFYISDELLSLISRKRNFRFTWIFCEALGLLCFAFAHLYLGWISVLNAGLAHVFLRLCYKRFEKLWPCVAAHFIYNVISLILL